MPRAQNAHAYVNAAFLVEFSGDSKVKSSRICFGGINPEFVHATAIEKLIQEKNLFENGLVEKAFGQLSTLLQPDEVLPDASPAYRRKLACGLFYKFLLKTVSERKQGLASRFVTGGSLLKRPVSSGQQSFETFQEHYPVTKATEKHEGPIQCSGEATYANDLPTQHNQLWVDVFIVLEALDARVIVQEAVDKQKTVSLASYLGGSMEGKIVRGVVLSAYPKERFAFDSYKVSIYKRQRKTILFLINNSSLQRYIINQTLLIACKYYLMQNIIHK